MNTNKTLSKGQQATFMLFSGGIQATGIYSFEHCFQNTRGVFL